MLIEMSHCPFCDSGHSSPCFARYTDGYKCFTCGAWKQADRGFIEVPVIKNTMNMPEYESNPKRFRVATLQWLYQYYLTNETIKKYCVLEADDGSLMFPAIINGEIDFYVRRWLGTKRIRNVGNKPMHIMGKGRTLVVVEDFISAIRIAEHTSTLCLFGTKCNKETINHMLTHYDRIILWLDGDKAGQDSAYQLQSYLRKAHYWIKKRRTFEEFNLNMSSIKSELDPKCYSASYIRNIIKGVGICK